MEHTKGPWEFFPAKDQGGDVTYSIRGDTEFIATLDTVSIAGGPYLLPPSGEANARLIAAAPELLEACQKLVARSELVTQDKIIPFAAEIVGIADAIAKAT